MFGRNSKEQKEKHNCCGSECDKEQQNANAKIKNLEDEIKKCQSEIDKWKNKFFENYADLDNLRKSIEKERVDMYKYRLESFADEIITVLDGFDMAFNYKVDDEKVKNFMVGFRSLHQRLLSILSNEGINEICPKIGDNFDVSTMKAIDTVFKEGKENDNKIVEVKFKGYKISDRLIRPASVIVSTNQKKETNEKNDNINK